MWKANVESMQHSFCVCRTEHQNSGGMWVFSPTPTAPPHVCTILLGLFVRSRWATPSFVPLVLNCVLDRLRQVRGPAIMQPLAKRCVTLWVWVWVGITKLSKEIKSYNKYLDRHLSEAKCSWASGSGKPTHRCAPPLLVCFGLSSIPEGVA